MSSDGAAFADAHAQREGSSGVLPRERTTIGIGSANSTVPALLALSGFAVSAIAAVGAQVSAGEALLRAVVALVVCYAVGAALGAAGRVVVRDHADRVVASRPVPDVDAEVQRLDPDGRLRGEIA